MQAWICDDNAFIVKVYEMKRDQARIARGEEPLSKDPPIIEVIDWTRKKS